jgi:long-subunit fatty acid transport protein
LEEVSVRQIITAGLLALTAAPAFAGGIERSNQSMSILFQTGRYIEIGASYGKPSVKGTTGAPLPAGIAINNIANSFLTGSISYKADLNEQWSYAIILDQPFGADALYPAGSPLATASGKVKNTTLTGVVRYKFGNGFSAFAGLRSSWTSGAVTLPALPPIFPAAYNMTTSTDQAFGYLVGVAYEKPEIALRVALTYNSKIKHKLPHVENGVAAGNISTNIPQSVNLEFQSGVAKDTLVFGSVRWVDWTDFNISGASFANLLDYQKDSITYTLGVGRKFNETWSGSVSLSHDTGNGNPTRNLGPIGKRTSLGIGASYTQGPMTISGGVQYTRIGSAVTTLGSTFSGNNAIGAGIRVGYRF